MNKGGLARNLQMQFWEGEKLKLNAFPEKEKALLAISGMHQRMAEMNSPLTSELEQVLDWAKKYQEELNNSQRKVTKRRSTL